MSLYKKHFNKGLHTWSIFTKKQSNFINRLESHTFVFGWVDGWWSYKFHQKFNTGRYALVTVLFFLWMPVSVLLMVVFAISGIMFLIYNKLEVVT